MFEVTDVPQGGRQAGTRVLMDASREHLSEVCKSELPLDCSS